MKQLCPGGKTREKKAPCSLLPPWGAFCCMMRYIQAPSPASIKHKILCCTLWNTENFNHTTLCLTVPEDVKKYALLLCAKLNWSEKCKNWEKKVTVKNNFSVSAARRSIILFNHAIAKKANDKKKSRIFLTNPLHEPHATLLYNL